MGNIVFFPLNAPSGEVSVDAERLFAMPFHVVASAIATHCTTRSGLVLLRRIVQLVLSEIADGLADRAVPNPLRLPYPEAVRRAADLLHLIDELEHGSAQG